MAAFAPSQNLDVTIRNEIARAVAFAILRTTIRRFDKSSLDLHRTQKILLRT